MIGVKNSSMQCRIFRPLALGREDHVVFNGPDEQFLGRLKLMGAAAGIGGTYWGKLPKLFLKTQSTDC